MTSPYRKIAFLVLQSSLVLTASSAISKRLMQGPMVGAIKSESIAIWARASGPQAISLEYSRHPSFSGSKETDGVLARAENDFCVTVMLENLEPNTFYYYRVNIDGQPLESAAEREGYPLLTAPPKGTQASFSVAFGSGARADLDGLQAIWLQVQNARPHVFFWLGENAAMQDLAPSFQAEQYRRQRSVPFLQPLLRSIPQLSTWDTPTRPENVLDALQIFDRYWPNPSLGTDAAPGSYFLYDYGRVGFFFLDTLTYRDETGGETILGKPQLAWLREELLASNAVFKVLVSGSSWTNSPKRNRNSWAAYDEERNDLFRYLREESIGGVILLSGDTDEAEIKALPLSKDGGYDLYEFVSSPLAQDPKPSYEDESETAVMLEEPYAEAMNFGKLSFDMSGDDPLASFQIINVFGESIFPAFEIRASQLSNGVVSWRSKASAEALAYSEQGEEAEY